MKQLQLFIMAILAIMFLCPIVVNAKVYKGTITIEVGEEYEVDLGFTYSTVSGYWKKSNSTFVFVSEGPKSCKIRGNAGGAGTLTWWGLLGADSMEYYWDVVVKELPTVVGESDFFITDDGLLFQVTDWSNKTCQIGWNDLQGENSYRLGVNDQNKSGKIVIPSSISGQTYSGYQVDNFKVTGVANNAFYGCNKITEIEIPNSVITIGRRAFAQCESLTSIVLPNSLLDISMGLFYGCTQLKNILLPSGIRSIGESAFYNCGDLEKIEFPNSLTIIGERAFENCSNLSTISFSGNINSVGWVAFLGTAWFDNLPNGIIYIDKVVYSCKGDVPSQINIKEGTETIMSEVFFLFSGKGGYDITLPLTIKKLERHAFVDYGGIKSIRMLSSNPIDISEDAFYHSSDTQRDEFYNMVNLYVPTGSLNTYKNAEVWKNFKNIVEESTEVDTNKGDINGDGEVNGTDLVAIANIILGKSEKKDAADLNGDGDVNGTDYVILVNKILGKGNSRLMQSNCSDDFLTKNQ